MKNVSIKKICLANQGEGLMKIKYLLGTAPLALAIAVTGGSAAYAQVGEIVVTAERREESLQDIKISITAIDAKAVQELGITDYLLDRIFAPMLAVSFIVLAVLGIGGLFQPGYVFAATAALAVGLAFGAELDTAGYITARYFGRRAYGTIFGWLFALFAVGGMASPLMYGLIYDATGSYGAALTTSIVALLAAVPLLLTLGRYPEWPEPAVDRT